MRVVTVVRPGQQQDESTEPDSLPGLFGINVSFAGSLCRLRPTGTGRPQAMVAAGMRAGDAG
jgi:hypothetical protein